MWNHVIRSNHFAMLDTMPFELLAEFWRRHALQRNGTRLSPAEMATHIARQGSTPLSFYMDICNATEPFYIAHNLDFSAFVASFAQFGTKQCGHYRDIMPHITKAFFRLMLRRSHSLVEALMDGLPAIAREQFGEYATTIVHKARVKGGVTYLFATSAQVTASDGDYFDHDIYIVTPFSRSPTHAGWPPGETLVFTDVRTVQQWVWEPHRVELRGDRCLIEGEEHGRRRSLHDFLRSDPRIPEAVWRSKLDDAPILDITRDYVCPVRKRTILHAGRAYGAPFWLFQFFCRCPSRQAPESTEELHREILEIATGARRHGLDRYRKLNERFVAFCTESPRPEVVFHAEQERITIGRTVIVRSIPARILAKMLQRYQEQGQTEFAYWEFRTDRNIIHSPDSHHLSRRIDRLSDALARKTDIIGVSRPAKGRVTLEVKTPFAFSVRTGIG